MSIEASSLTCKYRSTAASSPAMLGSPTRQTSFRTAMCQSRSDIYHRCQRNVRIRRLLLFVRVLARSGHLGSARTEPVGASLPICHRTRSQSRNQTNHSFEQIELTFRDSPPRARLAKSSYAAIPPSPNHSVRHGSAPERRFPYLAGLGALEPYWARRAAFQVQSMPNGEEVHESCEIAVIAR